MYRRMFVLFLFLVGTSVALERYALICGQNDGGATVNKLQFAESDAQSCSRLLSTHAAFSEDRITLVCKPDSATLVQKIDSIAALLGTAANADQTFFLFYYSGHADANGLLLESTHFDFLTLKKKLETLSAGIRIAVFDACQSGAVVAYKGGKRADPFNFAAAAKSRGDIWIASSSANEQAQESANLKGSLFSFHLFNGLRGSADVSADKKVTLNEAYQYAYRKTIETSALTSGIIQHPVYRFNISGEGEIVLTDFTRKQGGVVIDKACRGSFLILSRDYTEVFADFRKDEQKETFIALPAGDYTIINAQNSKEINLYQFALTGSKTVRCTPRQFDRVRAHESRIKGISGDSLRTQLSPLHSSRQMFLLGMASGAMLFLCGVLGIAVLSN